VLRRERDTDAGVGSHLVAQTIIWSADRVVDASDEVDRFGIVPYRSLDDREFIASQACDEITAADAPLQTRGHRFQQFVADHVSKRIVHALEFVDVDVQNSQLFARSNLRQFLPQPLMKQGAIGQIGQGVIVCEMPDLLLGP